MEVNEFVKKKKNVEKVFKNKTELLGWEYTDVLYSFLGIYVIGLYAFDKDGEKRFRRKQDGITIFAENTKNYLYSNKYIIEQCYYEKEYTSVKELNELNELKEFLDVYCSIGNIIPIWPGGNESRGKFNCYDLPEFYFLKDKIKPWRDFLSNKYDANLILNPYIMGEKENDLVFDFKNGIVNFLDKLDVDLYKRYLVHITKIIKERDTYLNKRIEFRS